MPSAPPAAISLLPNFDQNGFVLLEGLLDQHDIAALAAGVDWAIRTRAGHPWIKPRSYEWANEHPIFLRLIQHPLVLAFAAEWLGPDYHLIAAQCSRNTRDDCYAPGAMQWHQDFVFFPTEDRRAPGVPDDRYGFSAMWYVQDTPLEMGPTRLLPGTQGNAALVDEAEIEARLFSRPVRAGSLLLFNHRVWHTGAPNHTELPRDLITNAYARREIAKDQLLTPQPDGPAIYVCPRDLAASSTTLRRLLGSAIAAV